MITSALSQLQPCLIIITIIRYIYYVLINTLSAHMIRINLNTIFYTHVEHLPKQFTFIRYYMDTHTHTHTHTYTHMRTRSHRETHTHTHVHNGCSRNWVLILVGVEILWEEEGFQLGSKRWQGWPVSIRSCFFDWLMIAYIALFSACGGKFQMWVQSERTHESHDSCVCIGVRRRV